MPIHPSPPTDLHGKANALVHGLQAVIDLGHASSPADLDLATSCPGWSVRDVLAHVADIEAYLDGADHVEVDLPDRGHLRHSLGEWIEHGVQRRRGRTGEELVEELQTLLHNRQSSLANPELTLDTEVRGLRGRPTSLGTLLDRRLVDIWVHEQDIREALAHPGNLDTAGAASFVAVIVDSFPEIVASRVQPEIGTTIILESTGPVTARAGVRIIADDEGAPSAHPLFTGEVDPAHDESLDHSEEERVSIAMSTDALTRRSAGRRSVEDTSYRVVGDEALAERVVAALAITP